MATSTVASSSQLAGLSVLSLRARQLSAVRFLKAFGALGLLAYASHSLAGLGPRALNGFFENWLYNGLLLCGGLLCLARAVSGGRQARMWAVMAAGLICWTIGEVIYTLDPSPVTSGRFPTSSDGFWLAFYPAAFVTLGLLVRGRVRHFHPSLWLDGLVGGLATAALASDFLMPAIVSSTGASSTSVIADLIYPLADLVLCGMVLAVLALTGWRPGRVLGLLAAALLLGASADILSLYWSARGHSGSSAFDSLWPASAVLMGWAAWQPERPFGMIDLHGRRMLVLPVSFAVVALALLALNTWRPVSGGAYILALAVLAGAVLRLGLTFTENLTLVARSRQEALTDQLTGLGNRRALLRDLEDVLAGASPASPSAVLLFDLNGFKLYNDTFGHPVGDALLARLGGKLAEAAAPHGKAYRLGGDEFCVLTPLEHDLLLDLAEDTRTALCERGPGFDITTSCGYIVLPRDASDSSAALRLADEHLYADKRRRRRADSPDEVRDVLLAVMQEREPDLHDHLNEVAELARDVGRRLGLNGEDLEMVVRGAELHDLGKLAVPDVILRKEASLNPGERAIVERHAEVGERILGVVNAMRPVGRLVRASHENYDGSGYPDHRRADEIPLGARIIAVCDAFHAMTSDRPYRDGTDASSALAECRRHAGTQFDPQVVEAFVEVMESRRDTTALDRWRVQS